MCAKAVVTGASNGIGLELARLLARDGYDLLLVARSEERLKEVSEELNREFGVKAEYLPADLTQADSCERIFEAAGKETDILINNAGFGDYGRFATCDWKKQEKMIELNVLALSHLTHLFLPKMIEKGKGRILNLASVASFEPGPLMSVYYATKAYVLSFTEALASELKKTGVTAHALCPGPTNTGFSKAAGAQKTNVFKESSSASASKVAAYGYRKMMKGKTVIVCGIGFKFLVFAVRILPRSAVRKIVMMIQSKSLEE